MLNKKLSFILKTQLFIDLDMPINTAWQFIDEFVIKPRLKSQIDANENMNETADKTDENTI